jgi:hypothetical protein
MRDDSRRNSDGVTWVLISDDSRFLFWLCILGPFKEFSLLDAHPGWHPIPSNVNHFHTILSKDFENLMAYIIC